MLSAEHRDDFVPNGGPEWRLPLQSGSKNSLNTGIEQLNHILLDVNLLLKNQKFN